MIQCKIKDTELRHWLVEAARRGKNLQKVFTVIAGDMKLRVAQNFATESAPPDILSGKQPGDERRPWAPLSDLTRLSKTNPKILQQTSKLAASVGLVRIITARSLTFGTPEWLGAVHQFGAVIRPKRVQWLTLPFPGVKGRARDYTNTFFRGRVLYQNTGKDSKPRALFALKKQVTIPARPFMTFSAAAITRYSKLIESYVVDGESGLLK